ncbi:hypothetical protein [Shewanella fodinae]|jgi:hypothetical protein|uniref:Uncharacterized protein n=1 Tax=Shewanella fodinae TaxID=552357 RepID=A0A4R2F5W2_9GAMM|nr:hypothetical protein [Shewanella fodinae]MDN5369599.1 hypothetical protein [Shewanella sp.]TCN77708.1 hypothetical protein EDC91_1449 [Shewanella fodinae]
MSDVIDSVPVFGEDQTVASESFAQEQGETNDSLAAFVAAADDGEPKTSHQKLSDEVEKLSIAAAKVLVVNFANGLVMVIGMIARVAPTVSQTEIDMFAKDMAPLIAKYGNNLETLPPWLQGLLKYRVEIIAFKGLCLFAYSVIDNVRTQRQLLAKAKAELEKREAEEKSKQQPQQAAA